MNASPQPFRRRLLLNTAWTGVANVWAMVLALVTLPLLLKGLGSVAFGTWALLQTFSAVTGWVSLADLGVGIAATKGIAEKSSVDDHNGVAVTVGSAMTTFLALGMVCAAALALLGPALLPGLFNTPDTLRAALRFAVGLFALQIFVDLLTEGAEACLEGLQRVDLSRAVDAIRRTAIAAATSAVALAGGGLRGVAAASLVASLAGLVVGLAMVGRHLPARARPAPSMRTIRELFVYGKKVALLTPLGVIRRTMDRLIVGAVLGPSAVTVVEIATQVQNGADAVLSASSYSVVPTSSWLRARGDERSLQELLATGTRYSLLVTLPVVALGAILAGPLLRLWVGADYSSAPKLAALALAYIVLTAPIQVGSNVLLGVGKAGAILRAAVVSLVVNLVLSIALVHAMGVTGVFLATLVSAAFLVPLLGGSALAEVGIGGRRFVRTAVWPVVLAIAPLSAAAGAVVVLPLNDWATVALGALAGGAAYGVTVPAVALETGELGKLTRTILGKHQ